MASNDAYITGIGQSQIGVRLTRHPLLLTLDAIKEALAEAGLTIGQIDGVSTYPGRAAGMPGFSPVGADELVDALGIRARWYAGGMELTSQLGAVAQAAMADRTGQARHVIRYRTVYEAAALARPADYPMLRSKTSDGNSQWFAPFNAASAACWTAQYAMRHVKRYGMTREQLAQIAITGRAHAALNPRARPAAAVDGRIYVGADDHLAVVPVRLRSLQRCLDRADRLGRRRHRRGQLQADPDRGDGRFGRAAELGSG